MRGGGELHVAGNYFLDRFFTLASSNQVTTSLCVHFNSRMVLSGCLDSIDFKYM